MYFLSHLGLIFFMYPTEIIASTGEGHWIPIMIGVIAHFIILIIYLKGLDFFPNQNLISIYLHGIGKGGSALFLLPAALYVFILTIITIRANAEIINIILLSKTPIWSIMALLIIIAAYLAAQGVEAIFRTGVLLTFLFLPLVLCVLLFSFQNVDWHYIFPLIDVQFSFISDINFLKSFFAFSGGLLFLGFVQPHLHYQRKNVLLAAIFLIPFFLLSVYIPLLTFGRATASTFFLPFVIALDAVNINWLMFDRVTLFFLMSLITFIILYLSLVIWKMVKIVNVYIPLKNSVYLLVVLSAMIYVICLLIPNWEDVETIFTWNTFFRFYIMGVIPLSVYILGIRFRRKSQNEEM